MPYHHLSGDKDIGFYKLMIFAKIGRKNRIVTKCNVFFDFFYPRFLALFHKKLYICRAIIEMLMGLEFGKWLMDVASIVVIF